MPAYLVAELAINDPVKFEEYAAKARPTLAKHGARLLTKPGSHQMPEGGHWKPDNMAVIEFADMTTLDAWYNAPEYQPLTAPSQTKHRRVRHGVFSSPVLWLRGCAR